MKRIAAIAIAVTTLLACLAIAGCSIGYVQDEANKIQYKVVSNGVLEIDVEEVHGNEVICSIRDGSKNVDLSFPKVEYGTIITEMHELPDGDIGCEFLKVYQEDGNGGFQTVANNSVNIQNETVLVKFVFNEDMLGDWDNLNVGYQMTIDSVVGDTHEGGSVVKFKRRHIDD